MRRVVGIVVPNAAIVHATAPFVAAAIAWGWMRETPGLAALAAARLCLAGVIVMVGGSAGSRQFISGGDDMDEKRALGAARIVNLECCPIADLDSPEGAVFARSARKRFLEDGLCLVPGFIRPDAFKILAEEANGCIGDAWFCRSTHNVYLAEASPELPAGDAATRQERTFVGSIPYDRIGEDASLRRLYLWEPLKDFVGAVLGEPRLHRFADPLGACSVNVYVDGGEHGWHFDESEFSVSVMVQAPESGGAFEYVPRIRGRRDERSIVGAVLDGDRRRVRELPFTAGTLLIFAGRETLHRVTGVGGARPRLVPVLAYAERPGLANSEEVRMLFWGRTGSGPALVGTTVGTPGRRSGPTGVDDAAGRAERGEG